jgi:hypothetical protein
LWVAALALILCVLLHQSLFFGQGLVPADGVLRYSPWNDTNRPGNWLLADQYRVFTPQHEFTYQQLERGHFPLWNPYLACGMPNLASIQGALLFPINLLLLPLDPFYAAGLAAFLKLFLAGWFTMLYLRLLGASNAGALLGGMVFSLSGFMIVWLGHPHVNCAMWLPALFYFVEKTFRPGSGCASGETKHTGSYLRTWVGLAVAYGFMLLGGHPPTAIQITLVVVAYFAFRLWGQPWPEVFGRLTLLAGALAVGVLLAAPQLLPYLEYYRQSSSGLASAVLHRWAERLPPGSLVYFLLPGFSGSPANGFEDLPRFLGMAIPPDFNERTGYVGILSLFFALVAVVGRRCKFTGFHFVMVLVSLPIILGVPPFPALFGLAPILRGINEVRLLLFIAFGVAVLAGLGWDTFCETAMRRVVRWTVLVFLAGLGGAFLWLWLSIAPGFPNLDAAYRAYLTGQFFMLAGSALAIGALILWPAHGNRWVPRIVCLGWTAADLLCFGMGYNPAIPHDRYYPSTPAIQWLKQDTSLSRVIGYRAALAPDTADIFGLSDARGFDFTTVRRYEELITGKAGDFNFYAWTDQMPLAFPLLNVKYLVSGARLHVDTNAFELVYSNEMNIYRYRMAGPRAFLVSNYEVNPDPAAVLARVRTGTFDPQLSLLLEEAPVPLTSQAPNSSLTGNVPSFARVTDYEADRVSVKASAPRPEFLVLLDTWFPGWTATVNGEPAHIYRADYNFRAIAVQAGQSTVVFSYGPASFRIGMALSAVSLLLLGAAWCWPRRRNDGAPGPGSRLNSPA